MNDSERWNAVRTNDKSYDGNFYYGVSSTGVFCRPSCPSKLPNQKNVVFFNNAEEAMEKGFRPCKRCRPDLAKYDPASDLAAETKAVIERCFADRSALQEGLNTLGVTRRHLTEIFEQSYGLSPEQYIAKVRLDRAKIMLEAGSKITDTAFAVGMDSASAFATFFRKHVGVSPSEYAPGQIAEHPCRYVETPAGIIRIEEDAYGISSLFFTDNPGVFTNREFSCLYLDDAEAQLLEYFEGKRRTFDIPLSVSGSDFQKRVWKALQEIPYGETRSYQQIAEAVGNSKAARAVGMANNRNPISIIIPCHRVVGKTGKLVGYAGGIAKKQYLLEMEAKRISYTEFICGKSKNSPFFIQK